jgi:hypothetical protein
VVYNKLGAGPCQNKFKKISEYFMTTIDNNLKLLSAGEQTRLSWTKAIRNYDQIPSAYQAAFNGHFKSTDDFPYTLLAPFNGSFLKPTYEKLVSCTQDSLTIFERYPERINVTAYKLDAITYIETGSVLLYSWLTINGIDQDGRSSATTIKFNTVGDGLFLPILARIRGQADYSSENQLAAEQAKFDYLSVLNYKFMNYGRRSLLPGDRVQRIVLQPELRKEFLRLFGKSVWQLIFPAHILILTNHEVISIRDASKTASYGGIWNYVPLEKISSVKLSEEGNGKLKLCLELPGQNGVELSFEASRKAEVETLQVEIQKLISK